MPQPGKVYLVGAGPGDPGLLTLRGLECLRRADLVLYDGLVNPLLLEHTSATTERTRRAGEPGRRVLDQDQINERLIAAAREGRTVVRLKGGDPFLFGRGAEEAAALAAAGIEFEVVPGITAATAVAAYAGIPLTHRRLASAVVFVTGHEGPEKETPAVDYEALAGFPGTLVFYMGLHRLAEIAEALVSAGRNPDEPAAVISRGTLPAQRTITARLAELPAAAAAAGLEPPSLIVVGDCVTERDQVAWFERRPLLGRSVGITRPAGQADEVIARVIELGAEPGLMPTIAIQPPDDTEAVNDVLGRLGEYDWIVFTSANGVAGLLGRLWDRGGDVRQLAGCRLAAIGSATAEALERYHLRADLVPGEYRAEALAAAMAGEVDGARVLWARASRGRDVLPERLEAAGATLDQVVVYNNIDVESLSEDVLARIESGGLDWIGISSPSIARGLARLLSSEARRRIGSDVRLASISPVTSQAARDEGLAVDVEAATFTWDGLLAAIGKAESLLTPDGS